MEFGLVGGITNLVTEAMIAKIVVIVILSLAIAITIGTASTVVLYSATWGAPGSILWPSVLVAAGHLLLCGTYSIMGESVIEDAVKSSIIASGGGAMLHRHPLLGLCAISAAIWALVVNQGWQRLIRK